MHAQRKTMSTNDRQITQAIGVIREMSERIHLTKSIQDQAAKLYKDVLDSKALRGKNNEAQAAACLYIACRKEGVPRTFKGLRFYLLVMLKLLYIGVKYNYGFFSS